MLSPIFSVSDAVAVLNQSLDYAFPSITIIGEISDFRISKDKWIYFDIKDDESKLKCFGTIYQLRMPLESGMMVEIIANPRLHNLYGFSLNIQSVRPVGEGSIKKASDLLKAKLTQEGLFSTERKRFVEQAPTRIGVVSSEQSAGFADFIKIMNARWQGTQVELYDVLVQGESAPDQIVEAVHYFSQQPNPVDVVVVIRGGGSIDDLSAFSNEQVVRAVAASRIPTLVAIGHEVDESLSELAADLRASTPSNAAELLFPDKKEVIKQLEFQKTSLQNNVGQYIESRLVGLVEVQSRLQQQVENVLEQKMQALSHASVLLESVHPRSTLKRGYAIIQSNGKLVSSVSKLKADMQIDITLKDGSAKARVEKVQ
jgi:exodeoxyribonuclease VII large subunit